MRQPLRVVALVAVLAGTAACGGDDSTGPSATVAGTYTLRTVNGAAPPVVLFELGSQKLEILSSTLTIGETQTYSRLDVLRETNAGLVTTIESSCTGSYTLSGATLVFTEVESSDFCGGSFSGTWSNGNTITASLGNGAVVVVYRK